MPEPVPTTDVATEVQKGKPISRWVLILVGVSVVAFIVYEKKKKSSEEGIFQPAETGGQTAEGTIYPGGSGTGGIQALQQENAEFLRKFLESEEGKTKGKGRELGEKNNIPGRGKKSHERKIHNPQQEEAEKKRQEEHQKPEPKSETPETKPVEKPIEGRPPQKGIPRKRAKKPQPVGREP